MQPHMGGGGVRTPFSRSAPEESLHLKLALGEKSLATPGNKPAPVACQSDNLPTELYPHPMDTEAPVIVSDSYPLSESSSILYYLHILISWQTS